MTCTKDKAYSVYSEFDMKKHAETFVNYLEVVIAPDGKVSYAVPSHQEKLIALACEKYGITRDELNDMCPQEYHFDFTTWLCKMTGYISVWNDFTMSYHMTEQQVQKLMELKKAGLYLGKI